jgi:serine/threonine protein kinase
LIGKTPSHYRLTADSPAGGVPTAAEPAAIAPTMAEPPAAAPATAEPLAAASAPAEPPAAAAAGPWAGRVVSHYRLLGLIGGGGMGVVYKAEDTRLARPVALKFLPPELTRDPHAKARFLREARAASALDHPNVCTIHEVGESAEGQLFLVMACYEGETLRQRLARGPLPVEAVIDFALQIARGLAKAHRHGIVHRDVKPANLMITADEVLKILDFGIAKAAGATALTASGTSLGTPGYMSPEQARGGEIDARTDLWSLGAACWSTSATRWPTRTTAAGRCSPPSRSAPRSPSSAPASPTSGRSAWR